MTFLPEDIIEGETIVVPLSSSQNLLQTIGKHDPLALVCYWLKINLGEQYTAPVAIGIQKFGRYVDF